MYLFRDLVLYVTHDRFFFESRGGDGQRVLVIDRVTHEIFLTESLSSVPSPTEARSRQAVAGILGVVKIVSGPALVVAKDYTKVGDVTTRNHSIYRVISTQVLPFARSDNHLTAKQQHENSAFIAMLEEVLSTPEFYFSYSTDLSQSLQRKTDFDASGSRVFGPASAVEFFTEWDERFIWNRHLLNDFLIRGAEFLRYCLPLVHGACFVRQFSIGGRLFRWWLLSRKATGHAGTRFFARGLDSNGACANFVETEQAVEHANCIASFVQTRGSIPLFWSQLPNLVQYKPNPKVEATKQHLEGYTKHFQEQTQLYGEQVMVNLIDHRKAEGELERYLQGMHHTAGHPGVEYVAFDFHQECSNLLMWDSGLSSLIRNLEPQRMRHSYLLMSEGGVLQRQRGVIRTNCMDCLDRTNVVQSLLSMEFLQDALSRLQVLPEGSRIADQRYFNVLFRNVWADHADILSLQYAGTKALKTDFTRTGRRTLTGMMSDLHNSLLRYYKNNFSDGFRQDAIDFFLGNYKVEENPIGYSAYAEVPVATWITFLPVIFLVSVVMFLMTIFFSPEIDQNVFLFLLFWLGASTALGTFLYKHAKGLVNFPKLKSAIR